LIGGPRSGPPNTTKFWENALFINQSIFCRGGVEKNEIGNFGGERLRIQKNGEDVGSQLGSDDVFAGHV